MGADRTRVFGVGLTKTGTTTLGRCAQILGYRHQSCCRPLLVSTSKGDFSQLDTVVSQSDFFEDWPLIYRELDQRYPGSKFILTVREDEAVWLRSNKAHSMRTHPRYQSRTYSYGPRYPQGHEEHYLEFYRSHNQSIRDYFSNRPDQLLELCWERGDGWGELCRFLGCSVPDVDFPHENKGVDQRVPLSWRVINHLWSRLLA